MTFRKIAIEGATYLVAGFVTLGLAMGLAWLLNWFAQNVATLGVLVTWITVIAVGLMVQRVLIKWWTKRKPNSIA